MEQRTYTFNQSTLTVKFGDILDSQAEVIVSSDDCYVTMGGGHAGVSGAIYQAGGEGIMRDAQKMVPVPLGDVIATTAGTLVHQKYVFHCITIDKKRRMQMMTSQVTEEDVLNYLLQHAVDKCFQLMQAMELTSIAFPAIGAGAARIPIQKVIEQMSIAIARNLANTNRSLNVEFYLYDIYNIYSESDYITLFENLAAKAALVEYQQGLATTDNDIVLPVQSGTRLPDRNSMTHKVFISYSRKDQDTADYLCNILKENGIEYWIDKEGIYSSSNYKEFIVDAIDVSKAVIFISSENSNASSNVIREIGYAVNMCKPVLPLMLDDAPYAKSIRLDISDIDQIDFKNPIELNKKLITSLMYVLNK
ncbi:MAG: TIR domain-containing protein [Bacteroidales bacterium]|nr:TIR domain-containing protein [Bacteroidales bacterium]